LDKLIVTLQLLISLLIWTWTIVCLQYSRSPSWNGLKTGSEQSIGGFYTILLEEHLQIALEMLEVGNCSSAWSPKLTRVVQGRLNLVIVLPREDAGVYIHTLQTTTEPFKLSERGNCRTGKLHRSSEITSGSWDTPDYPTCPRTP
jgi:hypothetical protein